MARLVEYNEKDHQFHYNYYDPTTRYFEYPIFSNDYKPVCVLPDHYAHAESFVRFINKLADEGSPYERVCRKVLALIAGYTKRLEELDLD